TESQCVGCANLTAWCSGPRGCALTRDALLLDAVRLCAGVPARSTVRRDGDEVRVEDAGARAERKSLRSVSFYDRVLLGTNIALISLDSSVAAWVEAEWIPRDGLSAF
ncbi:unnamed protein product, partial [Prunus brigantina]